MSALAERRSDAGAATRPSPTPPDLAVDLWATALHLEGVDWDRVAADLDAQGVAVLPRQLTPALCDACVAQLEQARCAPARQALACAWASPAWPRLLAVLEETLYPPLVSIAHRWEATMDLPRRSPATLADLRARCLAAGQPHPLSQARRLELGASQDLGQDTDGDWVFPLQATVLLSRPGLDHTGGELVFTEQRPRMQSRPIALSPGQGAVVLMAAGQRPVQGTQGVYRVNLRHGVSRVRGGVRHALDLVFHHGPAPAPQDDAP